MYIKNCETKNCINTKLYKSKKHFNRSTWKCEKCRWHIGQEKRKVSCPNPLKNDKCLRRMSSNSSLCKSCSALKKVFKINKNVQSGITKNGFSGKSHSIKTKLHLSAVNKGRFVGDKNPAKRTDVRKKISAAKKRNTPIKGKTYEEYYGIEKANELKRLRRLNRAKLIQDGKLHPTFYNKDAIPIIEEYGKTHGYNFQHAENGGEVSIDGYWLDGYDKEKNIVIEFYERHHYNLDGSLKEKELIREQNIIRVTHCKFIRINAFDKQNIKYECFN